MSGSLPVAANPRMSANSHEARWYLAAAVMSPLLIVLAPDFLLAVVVAAAVAARILRGRSTPQGPKAASDDLAVTGIAFALAGIWSGVAGGGGFEALGAVLRFSLVPIGFGLVRGYARVDLRPAIWLGAVVGSIAAGVTSVTLLVAGAGRPTSYVNPIHFGEMALLLGAISMITRGLATGDPRRIARWTLVAVAAATTAAVLSQSHGGWVAVPAILVVATVHHFRSGGDRARRYAAALAILLIPVVAIALSANDRAALRAFDRGVSETAAYVVSHGGEAAGQSSVGARFEMWRSAFAGFRASPALGVGWGNMDERFAEDVDAGVRAARLAEHEHPHNQYLSHLGSGGIVGFVTLIALLAVPGWICLRTFLRRDEDARALGGAGLVIIIGYAIFSMTDSVFETASPLLFFVLAVGTIIAQIDRLESEQMFAYHPGDGVEQPERPVEGHRENAL